MAYIRVNEIDNSVYYNRVLTNDNIVLVGGSHDGTLTDGTGIASAGVMTLCTSLRDFYNNFGSTPLATDPVGWEYASNMIRAGFPVMYYSYYKSASSGTSSVPTDSAKIASIYSGYNLWVLQDKINYNIKFFPTIYSPLTTEGGADSAAVSAIRNLIGLVSDDGTTSGEYTIEGRGDGLILLDIPTGEASPYTVSSEGVVNTNDNYTPTLAGKLGLPASSYYAIPSPSGVLESPTSGNTVTMPPSFWILKTMAEGVASGLPVYSTFAGIKRGIISDLERFSSTVTYQTMREWTEVEKIIPLMNMGSYGNVIYGNSTRLHVYSSEEEANSTGLRSALDSLNVRIVANEIKRSIFNICLNLSFDSNDYQLWTEFKTKLSSVLDQMVSARAVNSYRVVMDRSTVTDDDIDNLRVPGRVLVDISRAAERFVINFELTQSGALTTEAEILQ